MIDIRQGDVLDRLREMPDESVHCVVTSPPYWGLRDYGVAGQLGLEPTLGEHIEKMVEVFREVRRVLRKDGTLWLNYGDCYASDDKWGGASGGKHVSALHGKDGPGRRKRLTGLKSKDLCMIPNRLAIALQEDGWWVRSEIIWHKPNPMPESIKDRPGTAHEKIWLLAKSARYFYDHAAVRTPAKNPDASYKMPDGWDTGPGGHGSFHREGREKGRKSDKQRGHSRRHAGFNDRWDAMEKTGQVAAGANLKNVWTIAPKGFKGAHFATFPPALIEPCIKAATSERGCCPHCGAGWGRSINVTYSNPGNRRTNGPRSVENRAITAGFAQRLERHVETLGWAPTCKCPPHEPVPATVLDPFGGAGTTALVASNLGRHAILIELNPDYIALAKQRLAAEVFS